MSESETPGRALLRARANAKIKGDNLQVVAARYARGELAQVVN